MSDIIRLLPDSIANQIAAGEVVQRPASVIKELMENSVDAGATKIKVIVQEAGRQLIQIIDDGKGMSPADVRLSVERHATSKITTSDDLYTLQTMGFRGEALASIAAVAQVEILSRRPEDEVGTKLHVDASVIRRCEPEAASVGTSVAVRNLFFNVPARRNFLKSNSVELRHLMDEFIRLALSHPERSWMLVHGDEVVFDLQPSKLAQRIVTIFGKHYQQQLAACQEEAAGISVRGYVGRPELARRSRSEQFLFVNNRFIRNNSIHFAVMSAFEGLMPQGSYPFYVLFINLDPRSVDVNVHPAKTEIKFTDERSVHSIVRVAVRHALGIHQLAPPIDFGANINMDQQWNQAPRQAMDIIQDERKLSPQERNNLEHWQSLMPTQSAVNPLFTATSPASAGERLLFQFQNQFILREVSNGLMVIDQQSAHERVLYDRYSAMLSGSAGESQQLLFPLTIDVSATDAVLVQEILPELRKLGFQIEIFGKQNFILTGTPPETASREREVLDGIIAQFKEGADGFADNKGDQLVRVLARRAAVRRGAALTREEQEALVKGLFSSPNPAITPDGRPTFFIFETSQMAGHFS